MRAKTKGLAPCLSAVNWDTYWLYVLTEVALSISPGPAVMLVIACGLAHGARRSVYASLGILGANAIYFAHIRHRARRSAGRLARILHCGQVGGRGLPRLCRAVGALRAPSPITVSNAGARGRAPRDLFFAGLTLQVANPKTLVFFVAILPQFVDARPPIGPQMLWLAAGSMIPEFFILVGYGWLASRALRTGTWRIVPGMHNGPTASPACSCCVPRRWSSA